MGLGQLLGFLWQKEVQLLMQLLPAGTGIVSSEFSIEPGTRDHSGGVGGGGWGGSRQGTRPKVTGNILGFQTLGHIIVYLGGGHPRSSGAQDAEDSPAHITTTTVGTQ